MAMAFNILDLPSELQLMVFGNLSDLDEALYLASTCRRLSTLFNRNKRTIARTIILSSDVYEYDLYLSSVVSGNAKIASICEEPWDNSSPRNRPLRKVFVSGLSEEWSSSLSRDQLIDGICLRWQRLRTIRNLYADPTVSAQFDAFWREIIATDSYDQAATAFAKPGFTPLRYYHYEEQYARRFSLDFKGRFHKAVILQSIGIANRQLPKGSDHKDELIRNVFAQQVYYEWSQKLPITHGHPTISSQQMKLDCLEIFDFFYMFGLRKVLPVKNQNLWILSSPEEWQIHEYVVPTGISEGWCWFAWLDSQCMALQPEDLAELIIEHPLQPYHQFPSDMKDYMACRGLFDFDILSDVKWCTGYSRWAMVDALGIGPPGNTVNMNPSLWWDWFRAHHGSPFQQEFVCPLD